MTQPFRKPASLPTPQKGFHSAITIALFAWQRQLVIMTFLLLEIVEVSRFGRLLQAQRVLVSAWVHGRQDRLADSAFELFACCDTEEERRENGLSDRLRVTDRTCCKLSRCMKTSISRVLTQSRQRSVGGICQYKTCFGALQPLHNDVPRGRTFARFAPHP